MLWPWRNLHTYQKSHLQKKNISKVFHRPGQPDFTALDRVNFSLFPGEILGIVGESGSGKSTVAKCITRLLDVSQGQIMLNGHDLSNAKGAAKKNIYRNIQMVFQSPAGSFDPRRTLGHGICESLRNCGIALQEAQAQAQQQAPQQQQQTMPAPTPQYRRSSGSGSTSVPQGNGGGTTNNNNGGTSNGNSGGWYVPPETNDNSLPSNDSSL